MVTSWGASRVGARQGGLGFILGTGVTLIVAIATPSLRFIAILPPFVFPVTVRKSKSPLVAPGVQDAVFSPRCLIHHGDMTPPLC